MTEIPEEKGAPIVGVVIESILVDQFNDELTFGKPAYKYGVGRYWEQDRQRYRNELMAAQATGQGSFSLFLAAQAMECNASTTPVDLYKHLASLGATVVQWMESLNENYGSV